MPLPGLSERGDTAPRCESIIQHTNKGIRPRQAAAHKYSDLTTVYYSIPASPCTSTFIFSYEIVPHPHKVDIYIKDENRDTR
ncbi:hypothetical protein N7471_009252 [Penicillium samsonianum]|uniref:uncharacterized protein n=1 Tax=Penicillium samsonianum TaxID=1882272 RepID=UPI002546BB70|nr:uncharacterized protein N7471_009252 [Penicillium samsonianum]KAJ6128035.1 hypothetical protein N7471_009252 [Penicillium samsonianum]